MQTIIYWAIVAAIVATLRRMPRLPARFGFFMEPKDKAAK